MRFAWIELFGPGEESRDMSEVQTQKMSRLQAIEILTAPDQPYELIAGQVWGRDFRIFKNAPATLRDLFDSTRSDETYKVCRFVST